MPETLQRTRTVFRRELAGYFTTPVAAIVLVTYLVLGGVLTFNVGALGAPLFESGRASLDPFFFWQPWLLLLLVPAAAMRSWADEHRLGTTELLYTLPVRTRELITGKFFAAWAFCVFALVLTVPVWVTVSVLGDPDHGVIAAAYFGTALMAGSLLAVATCISATTRSPVAAFVLSCAAGIALMLLGLPPVQRLLQAALPDAAARAVGELSLLSHFADTTARGVLSLPDLLFHASVIAVFLALTAAVLAHQRRR